MKSTRGSARGAPRRRTGPWRRKLTMKAGVRPPPVRTTPVRSHEWMVVQLEGTGITMIGSLRAWNSSVRRATNSRNQQASSRTGSRAHAASIGIGCSVLEAA